MKYAIIEHDVNYGNVSTREDEFVSRTVFGVSMEGESEKDFVRRMWEKAENREHGEVISPSVARPILESYDVDSVNELLDVVFVTVVGGDVGSLFVLHVVEE
jgi:hypothetical protein